MTDALELTRDDIAIAYDMEVDGDIGQEITFVMETWFDVDRKFGLHINDEDDTWLNMYGKYNPYEDSLSFECEISRETSSEYFDYTPTSAEKEMIVAALEEKMMQQYGQTPTEFCESFYSEEQEIGGLS